MWAKVQPHHPAQLQCWPMQRKIEVINNVGIKYDYKNGTKKFQKVKESGASEMEQ